MKGVTWKMVELFFYEGRFCARDVDKIRGCAELWLMFVQKWQKKKTMEEKGKKEGNGSRRREKRDEKTEIEGNSYTA